jgi:hypothetical protein
MTTLVVQELRTELTHEFRLGLNQRYQVAAFIPYLYVHNAPDGIFTFKVSKNNIPVFSFDFESINIQEAMGTTDKYIHAFYPIVPSSPFQLENGLYVAKLSSSGYTAKSNSFMGWAQQHENIQNKMDYLPFSDSRNPLAMRVKVYKQGVL